MKMGNRILASLCLLAITGCNFGSSSSSNSNSLPNILFVIMDDVGVDQMPSMGYGGAHPASMPSIDAIASSGVRFRNTWSMPECSPGRAALLAGRFPLRTNIGQAIGPNDLANSQLSLYEITTPKLLKEAGYQSAMFGKFHLAGPDYNPAGNGTPAALGWDYFYGWTGGLPASIDTTAGGIAEEGVYSCGYVPAVSDDPLNGADHGACYVPKSSDENPDLDSDSVTCTVLETDPTGDSAGLQCLARGGILVPHESCQTEPPEYLNFERENAHYVSPLVINSADGVEEVPLTDPRGRGYRSTIEADAARDWINNVNNRRDDSKPWMATLSFSAAHTPLQTPPASLLPSNTTQAMRADCRILPATVANQRLLSDALIEAMDKELGQLLIDTGIAGLSDDSQLVYRSESNTLVVIVGDNGSFGPTVKAPFDVGRAKGTAYQTGVWVPLIVAGPMVEAPNRDVEEMVNATDVFHLFGEVAGLNVEELVPAGTDGVDLLPYLLNPDQPALRDYNFTQGDLNIQLNGGRNGPCVISTMCSHTPVNKTVCEDNGGVWWGKGADDPSVVSEYYSGDLEQCWQVNQAIYHHDPDAYASSRLDMGSTSYRAIRNQRYKLVHNHAMDYDIVSDNSKDVYDVEFYEIDQSQLPKLDRADSDLLAGTGGKGVNALSDEQRRNYDELDAELTAILATKPGCPGDGNNDGRVDQADLDNFEELVANNWAGSSWYDVNYDGLTDDADKAIIEAQLGQDCQQ